METTNNTTEVAKAETKMDIARRIYKEVNTRGFDLGGKTQRAKFIELAMEAGLSKHCAGTYCQNLTNEANGKGLYKYNKRKPTKADVAAAEAQVLNDIGKHRWMAVDQNGVELDSFETRSAAQAKAKEVNGQWKDRTKYNVPAVA